MIGSIPALAWSNVENANADPETTDEESDFGPDDYDFGGFFRDVASPLASMANADTPNGPIDDGMAKQQLAKHGRSNSGRSSSTIVGIAYFQCCQKQPTLFDCKKATTRRFNSRSPRQ
jgi:hypothetical protein